MHEAEAIWGLWRVNSGRQIGEEDKNMKHWTGNKFTIFYPLVLLPLGLRHGHSYESAWQAEWAKQSSSFLVENQKEEPQGNEQYKGDHMQGASWGSDTIKLFMNSWAQPWAVFRLTWSYLNQHLRLWELNFPRPGLRLSTGWHTCGIDLNTVAKSLKIETKF